jgi:hypothetical protein
MRALLYTLILVNLLFFAWSQWIDAPRPGLHRASPMQTLATSAANDPVATRCASLGPLAAAVDSAALRTALQARNLPARERQAASQEIEGYWVYIDKLADATARARALARLSRFGVRDAAALSETGQVSVGLFSEKTGADKRAAAVRAAGFEPAIEVRQHTVDQYWLDVDLGSDVPLPAVAALIAGLGINTTPQWGECP